MTENKEGGPASIGLLQVCDPTKPLTWTYQRSGSGANLPSQHQDPLPHAIPIPMHRTPNPFSERTGTPFSHAKTDPSLVSVVITLIAYGCPFAAITAVFGVQRRTVRGGSSRLELTTERSARRLFSVRRSRPCSDRRPAPGPLHHRC